MGQIEAQRAGQFRFAAVQGRLAMLVCCKLQVLGMHSRMDVPAKSVDKLFPYCLKSAV